MENRVYLTRLFHSLPFLLNCFKVRFYIITALFFKKIIVRLNKSIILAEQFKTGKKMAGNGREWTQSEYDFLKSNFGKIHPSIIANKLDRTENTIRHRSYSIGLKSKVTIEREKKRDFVLEQIKNGIDCPWKLSELSGLHKDTCYKILLTVKTLKKNFKKIIEKTEGAYFASEKEIETALNLSYPPECLEAWEKFQLKQDTPKGCECPKLHTKQLNTYRL